MYGADPKVLTFRSAPRAVAGGSSPRKASHALRAGIRMWTGFSMRPGISGSRVFAGCSSS
jgi:hypothetical protein